MARAAMAAAASAAARRSAPCLAASAATSADRSSNASLAVADSCAAAMRADASVCALCAATCASSSPRAGSNTATAVIAADKPCGTAVQRLRLSRGVVARVSWKRAAGRVSGAAARPALALSRVAMRNTVGIHGHCSLKIIRDSHPAMQHVRRKPLPLTDGVVCQTSAARRDELTERQTDVWR
eukprot:349702-Chlamydomonas_euryale.AAC.1